MGLGSPDNGNNWSEVDVADFSNGVADSSAKSATTPIESTPNMNPKMENAITIEAETVVTAPRAWRFLRNRQENSMVAIRRTDPMRDPPRTVAEWEYSNNVW
jgi:hypothetical protein